MAHRGHIGKTFRRIAVVAVCLGGALRADAATKVWTDGAGANTNWATGSNWGGTAPAGGDSLVFAGTLGLTNNNNILANTSFAGITFSNNAGAFVLNGNAIKLTGNVVNNSANTETINLAISLSNTINLNAANGDLTFGGALSGAGGATLTGNNVVTLNGTTANTYAGMTTVNAGELDLAKTAGTAAIGGGLTVGGGTVKLINANQINDTASVTVNSGTFDLNGKTESIDALAGSGGTIINNGAAAGTLTIGANNGGGTYSGTITDGTGTLALTKSGTGTGTLTGNNGYSGATTISGGVLSVNSLGNGGASSGIGNSGSQAANLVLNGGALQYTGGAATIDRLFSVGTSSGTLDSSGSGGLTLNNTGAMGFNGQTGARTLNLTGTATGNTLAAVIGDNTGATSVSKTGAGSWALSGNNTYSGVTAINGGVLEAESATAFGTGSITLNGGVLGLGAADLTKTLGTGAGSLDFLGSGGFAAYGAARNVNLNGGATLTWASTSGFLANGSTLILGASDADNTVTFQNAINFNAAVRTIQVNNGSGTEDAILSGVLSGTGASGFTKTGNGMLELTGSSANTFAGLATVSAGELDLGKTAGTDAIGAGGLTISGGLVKLINGEQINNTAALTINSGTFDLNDNSESINALNGTGGTILDNGSNTGTLTIGANNGGGTYSGTIADGNGTVVVVKAGTGTGTLSGNNSYSGDTIINAGTLALGSSSAIPYGAGRGNVVVNGRLNLGAFNTSVNGLSGNGTIDIHTSSGSTVTLTVGNNDASSTFGGVLTDAGGTPGLLALTKVGAGTLVLSGNNNYYGKTTVSGGALQLASSTALGNTAYSGGVTVSNGAALQLSNNISISGGTYGSPALTLKGTGLSDGGALENVSGNNTYAGAITLGSATRINSDSGTLTLSSFSSGGNFALTIGGAGNVSLTAALPATVNSLTKDGTGTLILANSGDAYVGATLISAGTLKLGASNVLPDGAGKGDVTVNDTLDMAGFNDTVNGLNGSGTVDNSTGTGNTLTVGGNNANSTFAGVIQNSSGSLGLAKTGTGTLILSGGSANTYSGVTTVNAGELDLNKSAGVNAIGGNLTVAGGEVKLLSSEQLANGAVVTVNSGSFNLNGATETTGNMIIGPGGLLTNGVAGGTLNGGITNSGTIFASQATYLNGPVTNTGSIFFIGAISNNLVNRGSFTLNDDSTLTAAPVNTGTMDANGNTLTVTPDWANSGTILLGGGSLAGGNLTNNSGATVMEFGAISNAVINSGNVIATNGELRLVGVATGTGAYKAAAGASAATLTFAGGGSISALFNTNATIRLENVLTNANTFVNQGTLALAGGTYQSAGNLTNVAGKVIIGSGTISAQRLVNLSTAVLEATNGTLTLLQAPVMQGIVNVRSDGALQFGDTGSPLVVTNGVGGSIRLYGGTISFSALTNSGNVAAYNGGGTLTGVVINAGSGSIDATNGTLVFLNDLINGGLVTNSSGIQIGAAGTGAITNSGTYVFAGGTLAASVITNTGTAIGSGVDNADMVNSGFVTATNGELRLQGTASGAGTYRAVAGAGAATLTFAGGGSISTLLNTNSTIRVENSSLTNTGIFVNRGTLTLAGGTYQSSASVNNTAGFQIGNAPGTTGTLDAPLVNAGSLAASSGTLTLLFAPAQSGAVNIGAGGVLNVVPDWVNSGTINFTAGGAITGGNLTNTSASGTISGAGFINSFLVNQNRLDINGLTISNDFLQTAGSFTISGTSTITGNAMVNGGTLNLQGKRLEVDSLMLATGATLTNGIVGATLNGGVTNAGTVNFAADVYVLGPVTNTGTWLQRGAISNEVYNAGTLTLMANTVNPRVTGGLVNNGSVLFSNGAGYISGAVTNSGSISFQGAISNSYVQTGGSITLANAATITGTASISGGNFDLNGKVYTNGQMIVSGSGMLSNGIAGAIFNGGLTNASTVFVSQTTTFNGPVTNTGTFVFQGTINNALNNSGSFALNGNATLATAPVNSGTINVAASTLTVVPAWGNSGTILIAGGTLAGGNLTNASGATVSGAGAIAPLLVNNGLLVATNGTLTLSTAPQQNGVVNVADGAAPGTLSVTPAWNNKGTVNIASGGTVAGGNFTNTASGTVTNFGAINTLLVNQGNVVLGGKVSNFQQTSGTNTVSDSGTVTGTATISGGLFDLNGGTYSNGLMVVSGSGVLTSTQANATFNGGLSNAATASFSQNTYFNGTVTNTGAFLWQGAISNNLVNSGTVRLNNDSTITGLASITGGSFDLNGNNYSNRLMVISGSGVLTNAVAGATFNGGLSNAATVSVTANTYFNGPVTNTGAMYFQGAISNALVNSGSFNLNNNATLTVAPVNNGTFNIDGDTLTVIPAWANAGTLLMSGGVLAGGTMTNLANGPVSGFGTISNLLVNAGLVTATGGTLTFAVAPTTQAGSGINVAGSGVLNVVPDWSDNGTIAINGTLVGGTLTNTGANGTLSGSGFIDAFLVNQGRVSWGGTISNDFLQTAGSFTLSGGATITGTAMINGGTLDLVGNRLTDGLLQIGVGATLTNGTQNATLNGGITNAGTVNLFRDTYVNGPVTNTGTWIQRGAISNNVVNSGVMALYSNSINVRVTGSIVNSGSLTFDTNGIVYVSGVVSNSGSFAFSDVISNNLVNTGNGSITLNGAGTVTGSTMVNGGTFDLNGKSFTDSFMVVSGTGVLTNSVAGAILNGGLSNAATVSFTQNVTLNGPVTNMATFAWQGTINNSYTQGAGTNLLNGNATITGNTTISDGLVNLNSKNATFGSLNGGGGTFLNNGNGASVMTVSGGGSYSGTIADHTVGTGTMAVTVGGGVLTLSGDNSYSGATTINSGGTLKLGSALALGSTAGNTVVNSGGVLDLNGQAIDGEPVILNGTGISNGGALINSSVPDASLGGAITLASASSIGGSGDMTLSGAIGGANNLTKVGAGTVTLTAANGYTGATVISGGALDIQNNTALGTVAGGVTVASGAALELEGGITVGAEALSLNGSGISNGGALRNVSGNNTYGGVITLTGASRINSDAGTLALGAGITGGGSALTIGGAGNVVAAGSMSGTGATLTKDGAGTLNLTGNNTYTGATAVNGGTLKVNNTSGSGISGGSVAVNNGGTLGGTGTITVGVTVNNGGDIAPGNGVGTFNVARLTLASGSVLDFEFNSTPANDVINVLTSGGLTLNGGGFNLYQEGTTTAWSTEGTYDLISYSGALAGSIGNLSVLNPAADKVYTFGTTGSMITLQIAGGQGWTGLGSDNFWSSGANWSTATPTTGDLLVFDGTTRINNTNDLAANTQFSGITYDASAGAFTNNGNAVNLTGDIVNNSTNTQTIKLPLVLDGNNRTINAASGALVVSGPISDTNGTWGLIKSGAGTVTISGTTANTYSGLTTVNTGELDLNKTAGQNAVGGDLSIGSGATVRLLSSGQIGDTANVTVNNGGQFNLNGFAETIGGMANAGTIAVGGGALTVSQTLQNSGTVTLTAGGAVGGGVLSNLTSGLVSGSGFIKSLVVNQGRLNFAGTISNDLVQTAGSFILSGNATITGNAMLNGGSLDLDGDALTYNSLSISSGAVLQNGGSGAAIMNGNVTNSGLVNFFVSSEATVNGNVVNSGEWDQTGVINGNLVNSGDFTWLTWTLGGTTPHLTGGIINSGSMALNSSYAEQIDGSVTNTGTIAFHGTIGGNYVQTAGSFSLDTAGTISGTATVTGGRFDLSGVTYTGSRMIVAGTGVLTNSIAGATFNSGLSNAANVGVTVNTFFKGPVTNTGTFAFMGAVSNTLVNSGDVVLNGSGTISGVLVNSGSVNVNSGTLSLVVAPTQTGSITVNNATTLSAAQAWVNNGTITLTGGNVVGSTVTNAGTMKGFGVVQSTVNNGLILVTNGTLQASASFTQNGTVNVAGNTRLDVTPTWLNSGTVLLNGGFTSGSTMTNGALGSLAGFGTISNAVVNAGSLVATNGTLTVVGALTQSGTIGVANAATFNYVPAWQNGGFLSMLGGTVIGGQITNAGSVTGFGTFSPSVINNSGATITASSGGTLTLTAIPFQSGIVNILGTLNVASAWSNGNAGTVAVNGGVLTGGTFTVNGTVGGNGTIAANMIVGSGKTVTVSGGTLNVTALTTLNGGAINSGALVNYGTVSGNGTIGSTLSNPGYVRATNGLLYVQALSGSQATGTLEASSGATLQANGVTSWVNNGHVILSGGTVIGGDISNGTSHIISGFGTIAPNVYNSGQLLANNAGQTLTLNSSLVNLSSGVVTANTGNLVVEGAFVNQGTLAMAHSMGTFASAVVNSGAWITDPTTNVFQDTYTLTSSGYIQASAGDVYVFTNNGSHAANFVNQSTQSNAFNTVTAKFVFDATLSLTQTMYAAGSNLGNLSISGGFDPVLVGMAATNALFQFQNNFALGTLEIGSTMEVAGADVNGGVDPGGLQSALFINELDLDPGAHLIISNNVQIYFITSNAFSSSQITLLGDAGLHLLTSDASLVVPEPTVVLLWLSSIATLYAARKRAAGKK